MQRNVQVHVFCCGVQKDFAVDNNDHAVRSRQAVASTTEWASMRGLLKAGEMSIAVYDSPCCTFYSAVINRLAEQTTDDVIHLVYRCHGGGANDDDLALWMLSKEYDDVALAQDVKKLIANGHTVVVWVLSCFAGAALDSFANAIGKTERLLVICATNKWETSTTQIYYGYYGCKDKTETFAGKIELIRMMQRSPTTRWCDMLHFLRDQHGPVNTYPCYGNWSLYPFAEHASSFDFVQPLRFQRKLSLPSIHER